MEFALMAFSTFLGAAVALTADRWSKMHDARLAQETAVNNLILDLAAKRCFLVSEDWTWGDGEVKRVVDSVHHARTLVRDARLALIPRSDFLAPLLGMNRSCNVFIELSEREDEQRLTRALRELASEMTQQVEALRRIRPKRILADKPGSSALHEN